MTVGDGVADIPTIFTAMIEEFDYFRQNADGDGHKEDAIRSKHKKRL